MAEVFDWQHMEDPRAAVERAVQAIRAGGLAAFPTETVYGIAADARSAEAVERLVSCKGRPEDKPLALALRSPLELPDWVPRLDRLGRRLSRRGWPGPLTLVFEEGVGSGLAARLPEPVRRHVCPRDSIGLRVPAHESIREALRTLNGPVVLTSANRSGEPDAVTGRAVIEILGDRLDVIIDDGLTKYGQPSSVVKISQGRWELLREGVLHARTIERMAGRVILFVCTGNTCRSPLAEGLCKKLLSERQGCTPEELSRRGFLVLSAGISAIMGCTASPEAIDTARSLGVNLDVHVSQPLTLSLLAEADFVFAMTRGHRDAIAWRFGVSPTALLLVSPEEDDIPDPIGGDRSVYEWCAKRLMECLEKRLPELVK